MKVLLEIQPTLKGIYKQDLISLAERAARFERAPLAYADITASEVEWPTYLIAICTKEDIYFYSTHMPNAIATITWLYDDNARVERAVNRKGWQKLYSFISGSAKSDS